MSSDPTPASRSLLVRFCDNFLQERNIRWLLVVGMLILLGSSVLLVSTHWDDYTPPWKYLIFLAYTAAIFGVGEWTRHRLALTRTATALQVLTLLLLPVTFLVLYWVQLQYAGLVGQGMYLGLGALNLVVAVTAARRIFQHFLRGRQPTFLASYLILCLAGAIVPGLPEAWAPIVALALLAVFAAGSVKVNRHVFWLTEEHRAPRIFGFFPILLLGAQFLMLFALHAPRSIGLDWLGLGCVLVAIPVLLTADAVARVFQQRTGDLVRPLPWVIVGPLGLGLLLCVAGICLAASGIVPPNRPYALVPAAALMAVMMAVVARRTGKQAFVWAMLAGVVLAYNFSPAFFADLVRSLADLGARAVQEERLPIAFYGLTYLPLLLISMVASRWRARNGDELFAVPLRYFAIGLGCLMLAVAAGHVKALFPVAICMTLAFALQVAWFRDGRLALLAIASWIVAAAGLAPFASQVLGWSLPAHAEICCLAIGAGLLLIAGRFLDRIIAGLFAPVSHEQDSRHDWPALVKDRLCQSCSLALTLGLAGYWLAWHTAAPFEAGDWPASMLLAVLLVVQALWWIQPLLGGTAILFFQAMILGQAFVLQVPVDIIMSLFTVLLLGQWLAGYLMEWHPHGRIARAFSLANYRITCVWLSLALVGVYLPILVLDIIKPLAPHVLGIWLPSPLLVGWPCKLLIVAWAFDAARREASPTLATLGSVGVLGLVGAVLMQQAGPAAWMWLPAAWAIAALAALPIVELMHQRLETLTRESADAGAIARYRALSLPITYVALAVLVLAAAGSLLAFPLAMRVAGAAGLLGLGAFAYLRRQPEIRLPALVLINWQVLALTVLIVPSVRTLFELAEIDLRPLCLPIAVVAAGSLLLWQARAKARPSPWQELVTGHLCGLRTLLVVALIGSLRLPGLESIDIVLAAATFALAIAAELTTACRQQKEERVWIAEAVALAAVCFFAFFRVVAIGRGTTMFAVLGVGVLLWLIGEWARSRPKLRILVRPFQQAALVMPLATVGIGVCRHLLTTPIWLGANSLALLLAAGFYFWRGLEWSSKPFLILAGAILNVALVLLWRELAWTDPQFFMIPVGISVLVLVQLLKREIPERFHDPLRYLGALVILVSPTFHIVGGSWIHLFSLLVVSVGIVLVAIGLRVRALMYTGTAFLVADLIAMVVRGSIDNPNVLWIACLLLGASVIALGGYCERNREVLLARMRVLSGSLKQWQ